MTIVNDENGQYSHIACGTCGKRAPSNKEIMERHGLMHGFGWYCSGGTHICADCPHPAPSDVIAGYAGLKDNRDPASDRGRRDTRTLP